MSELFSHPTGRHAVIARIEWWLEQMAFGLLLMVVGFLPWIFSQTQLDSTELPKQTVLVVSAGLVWFLLVIQDALRGAWHIAWDRYAKIVFIMVGTLALLAIASRDPYGSWVGMTKQIPTAVFTMLAGAAWWLASRRLVNAPTRLLLTIGVWMTSAAFFAWGTAAWLLGTMVWPWTLPLFRAITPLGTVSEVAIFLVPTSLFAFAIFVEGAKVIGRTRGRISVYLRIFALLVLLPSLLLIGAIGSPVLWFALAAGAGVFLFLAQEKKERIGWSAITILCLASVCLSLFSPSWNPWRMLGDRISLTVPAEVTLGAPASWKMALQGFQEHPVVGRGAGTWVSLFLQKRDPALNLSPYATVRFFQASSSAATAVGTGGLLGSIALLVWLMLPGAIAMRRKEETSPSVLAGWKPYLLAVWVTNIVLWLGLSFALIHVFFFWLLSALLVNTHTTKIRARTFQFDHPVKGIFPLTIATLVAFVCAWVGMQRFLAERLFVEGKNALEQQSYTEAERRLHLAHAWNPWTDVYTNLLSQAYLQEARMKLAQQPDPKVLPEIAVLLTRAERLNTEARLQHPDRVESWLAAASIASTRNLLVAPALRTTADIAALLQAQGLDPSNPQGALLLASVYLQRAESEQAWLASNDEQVKTAAKLRLEEAVREVTRWYDRAELLQPNLPAVFAGRAHLALLLGKNKEAIEALEALEKGGNKTQELQIQIALLYEQTGKTELAMRLLEAVVKDHPEGAAPLARWSLARLYAASGRLEEAMTLLESLAAQFPHESIIQRQLAELQRVRLEESQAKIQSNTPTSTISTVPTKTRAKLRKK